MWLSRGRAVVKQPPNSALNCKGRHYRYRDPIYYRKKYTLLQMRDHPRRQAYVTRSRRTKAHS